MRQRKLLYTAATIRTRRPELCHYQDPKLHEETYCFGRAGRYLDVFGRLLRIGLQGHLNVATQGSGPRWQPLPVEDQPISGLKIAQSHLSPSRQMVCRPSGFPASGFPTSGFPTSGQSRHGNTCRPCISRSRTERMYDQPKVRIARLPAVLPTRQELASGEMVHRMGLPTSRLTETRRP